MKSNFPVGLVVILLLSVTNLVYAISSCYDKSSYARECLVFSPSMPAIPQDDGFLCGDVNEDILVNVLDIISTVNYILGGNPDPFNLEAADVNADDWINVLDIIGIVNIILQTPGTHCPCVPTVDYAGQMYNTVQIGEQCWLKENLNVGTMIISDQGGPLQTNNGEIEKYCYDNDANNCITLGGLYEYDEARQYSTNGEAVQGICPPDFHIPSDVEWKMLEGTVDSQFPPGDPVWDGTGWRGFDAGSNLKEAGNLHWDPPNEDATNLSGFTALPGGFRSHIDGGFVNMGTGAFFRTSTEADLEMAWRRQLASDNAGVDRRSRSKSSGFSVRCLKGCVPQPTQANAGPDQIDVTGTVTYLAGNTPVSGTGTWEIVSGEGGTVSDMYDPSSEFHGIANNEYALRWNITTVCATSEDEVVISFAPPFECGDPWIDPRDGQSYPTVQIGVQCWMAKNLNVGTMLQLGEGCELPADNGIIEKYCHNNDANDCLIYGGIYLIGEAMQYETTEGTQGICPFGWYIPTDIDWKLLEGIVDSQFPVGHPEWDNEGLRGSDAGGNLKETGTVHWIHPNTGATNQSGFTALPSGKFVDCDIVNIFQESINVSSTQSGQEKFTRVLINDSKRSERSLSDASQGLSVRCIKECDQPPTPSEAGPDLLDLPGTATPLQGNSPTSGTGEWSILTGTGGFINDPSNPGTIFSGVPGETYVLLWKISTECGTSFDRVTVSFAQPSFTCGDPLIDERDGQSYETVQMGTPCWMKETLKYAVQLPGANDQTDNGIVEGYCYDDNPANCDIYGFLYQWPEAMGYTTTPGAQGICPTGWHIPSLIDWNALADFLGGVDVAGGKMKTTGTVEGGDGLWYAPNLGATNSSGFSGLPAGYRDFFSGEFFDLGIFGDCWSSNEYSADEAWDWFLFFNSAELTSDFLPKTYGFPVRCVKDD